MVGLHPTLAKCKIGLFESDFRKNSLLNAFDRECGDAWVYLDVTPVKHIYKCETVIETAFLRGVLVGI